MPSPFPCSPVVNQLSRKQRSMKPEQYPTQQIYKLVLIDRVYSWFATEEGRMKIREQYAQFIKKTKKLNHPGKYKLINDILCE